MKTIKLGSIGSEVGLVSRTLGLPERDVFDDFLEYKVVEYQETHGLVGDGVVGNETWLPIMTDYRQLFNYSPCILESDLSMYSDLLSVSKTTLKTFLDSQSVSGHGLIAPGVPVIKFEAHVFYNLIDEPQKYIKSHPAILSPRPNQSLYRSGKKEYDRLYEAAKIDEPAAIKSVRWGKYQVLGKNYSLLGCSSIYEMVDLFKTDEFSHLLMEVRMIKKLNLIEPLQHKDWETIEKIIERVLWEIS